MAKAAGRGVDDIADVFLGCRDYGHAWRAHDVRIARKAAEIHRVFECLHGCGTQRTQVLNTAGYLVRNFYVYADGYVLVGAGRLTAEQRAQIRVASTNYLKARGL
jgi:hypothetical protein